MIKTIIKYPHLEVLLPTIYQSEIHALFVTICRIPLCWLAMEELESGFSDQKINQDLYFCQNENTIEFRLTKNDTLIAKVYFEG